MRYLLTLLTVLAILAVAPVSVPAGPLTKPPKLDKMLKPPKKCVKPGASYNGPDCVDYKKLTRRKSCCN